MAVTMDPISLTTFTAVARRGSVSAAALDLHTVQSNVTARIKQLESDLGVTLFVRHSRGVRPTAAGDRLLGFALRYSLLDDEVRTALREDGAVVGQLRLGTMETTAAVRLPPLLTSFHKTHPEVQLEIRAGTTAELLEHVLAHRLDGAFVAGPIDHPDLKGRLAFREELMLVSSRDSLGPGDRLAGGRLTAVVFRPGCSYRQRLETAFASKGWLPYQRLELGTLDGMLGCVAADIGVTVLPLSVIDAYAGRKRLRVEALGREMRVDTLFVRRADAHRSPAMTAFEDLLGLPGESKKR
jgi:DNA-binding transcriptional LysR family regulator